MFEPVRKLSIADEITEQFIRKIINANIKPGDKLPPERELAKVFNTNRNTLREAIRNLESLNLIEVKQGDGLKVKDFKKDSEINIIPFIFKYSDDIELLMTVLEETLMIRRSVLADAVSLATKRANEDDIKKLKELVLKQKENLSNGEKLVSGDIEFTKTLIEASHSLVAKWLFNTFLKIYVSVIDILPEDILIPEGYIDFLNSLVNAIENREEELAKDILTKYYERSDEKIIKLIKKFLRGGGEK